jgi:hypothetical protein
MSAVEMEDSCGEGAMVLASDGEDTEGHKEGEEEPPSGRLSLEEPAPKKPRGLSSFFKPVVQESQSRAPPPPSLDQLRILMPVGTAICEGATFSRQEGRAALFMKALGTRLASFYSVYNPDGDGHCLFR